MNYSVVVPTCRRYQNLSTHIQWLENMEPSPNRILVVHPINEWTPKFDWTPIEERNHVRLVTYEDDPGLFECKYTAAFEHLDDDFIFTVDDDVYPGKKYPQTFFGCYNRKRGLYGGIGFIFDTNHFEGYVVGGSYDSDRLEDYQKIDRITRVDAIGQSFFWRKQDLGGPVDMSDLPEWACRFCSDDLYLSYLAWERNRIPCYVTPHLTQKNDAAAVYELREGNLEEQSLVGGGHPDSEHKNRWLSWIRSEGYTIRKNRADYDWRNYLEPRHD